MCRSSPAPQLEGARRTHLLAVGGGVDPKVQAGFASEPEDLLEQVLGEVLEGGLEDEVEHLSVLVVAMVAEVDEVLDVVVGTEVLDVLRKTERYLLLIAALLPLFGLHGNMNTLNNYKNGCFCSSVANHSASPLSPPQPQQVQNEHER